ncbi:MAG: hypothetical protein GTO51_10330 [Candidatus Latescibacteria bacterium]|nr:hypothetical protein [Candidatus Latescibacterota bacterium]NIM66364.1 hypothetical protein [Candidatus Latescibacterota bacterium]NIO02843.1 hypothetical protein [Candidatus Latescibacterota bacterium]NIO29978.1 hypothetical protein [Candidatus Latescibacterota bacterium]NIO57593.1 hypothetical protein [Candidatus Latescibacterota bacterium]
MKRFPISTNPSKIFIRITSLVLVAGVFMVGSTHLLEAGTVPPDYVEPRVDTLYSTLVRQYTSDARYLSPLVAQLPDHPTVPSPREFLGYIVGAPKKLTYYRDIKAYMEALDNSSPRVTTTSIGRSNEGREMIVVFVADERTLNDLDRYAAYTAQLADPRATNELEAQDIIQLAKPFYYVTGGLHSTETGSPDMLMELAYRLATGESPLIKRIRENVITMITPVLETDGRERVVDWYYKYTVDHTDWEDMPPKGPPYWGKYIFHDNNRDGIQLSQPLSRNLVRTFFKYHPQVMHDLHESLPLLYVSSGTGPYNEALDPIVTSEWQWISIYEVTELTKFGMPGVWTWGFYTGWYPGYLLWFANNHNSIGRFYETFGNAGASTFERKLEQSFAERKVTRREWYRPLPPEKKIKWAFRNNTNYMETGILIALNFAAQNAKTLLFNFWKKGNNAVERGLNEAPYAWIIPRENQNKFELSYFINNFLMQRIEVQALEASVTIEGERFPKGSFVVRMDQPYRDFAKSLFEIQRFPEDAQYRPYDDVAWTLPILYGVEARRIDTKQILDAPMSPVEEAIRIPGTRPGKKSACYLIPASRSQKFLEARLLLRGFDVFAAETSFSVDKRFFPRGSWIITAEAREDDLHEAVGRVADSLSLDVYSSRRVPDVPMHSLDIPRIAVFHTWTYTQDSGWVRYTLDRAGIPYTLIDKDDLREGNLRALYEVILIPNLGGFFKPKRLVHGVDTKWSPLPYESSAKFGNIGEIDQTPDMTGGMGFVGLVNLEKFIHSGGTLVTLGYGSLIPVEMGLVRHVDRVSPKDFMNPGSLIRVRVTNPKSHIVCGYDTVTTVFRGSSPLLTVSKKYKHLTALQYGTKIQKEDEDTSEEEDMGGADEGEEENREKKVKPEEPLCVSGIVKGEKHLDGQPAILDIPTGNGRVILFSFNPLHRYMTHANFAFVYNAILHWND